MTFAEHVGFGAVALRLPNRKVLIRESLEHVSFEAVALGFPHGEVLIRDSRGAHLLRASALGLPNREVLHVTLKRLFNLGRYPLDSRIGSFLFLAAEEHDSFR